MQPASARIILALAGMPSLGIAQWRYASRFNPQRADLSSSCWAWAQVVQLAFGGDLFMVSPCLNTLYVRCHRRG